jgi:hypothetical protein
MKYLVCRIEERAWSALKSLDLEELLVLILCLLEKLIAAPFPINIMAPVCLRQLSWTAWEASTHHRMVVRLSAERLSFIWQVP